MLLIVYVSVESIKGVPRKVNVSSSGKAWIKIRRPINCGPN
jgi:hypothetical protein